MSFASVNLNIRHTIFREMFERLMYFALHTCSLKSKSLHTDFDILAHLENAQSIFRVSLWRPRADLQTIGNTFYH